jgi:hypothetical protein
MVGCGRSSEQLGSEKCPKRHVIVDDILWRDSERMKGEPTAPDTELSLRVLVDATLDDQPAIALTVGLCTSEAQRIASRHAFEDLTSPVSGASSRRCLPAGAESTH